MESPHTPALSRLVAVVTIFFLVATGCGSDSSAGVTPTSASETNEVSVDIDYATLEGGQANLTDFAGQPIVLNFFAAWCASCVGEMPQFEEVHRAHGEEITFVGMSEDLLAADSLDLIEELGITYRTGWDPGGEVLNNFRALVMPTTVFITSGGEVAHTAFGPLDGDELERLIDEHLVEHR